MVGLEQQGNVYILYIHFLCSLLITYIKIVTPYGYILCFRPMLTLPHSSWRISILHHLRCSLLIHFIFQAHADTDTLIMKNVYTPPLEVFIIYTFYVSGPCWHCHTHHEKCIHSITCGVYCWYILCFRPMLTLPHSSWRMSTLPYLGCSLLINFMFQAHADNDTLIMKNVYTPPLEVFIIYTFYVSGPCWHCHTHHEKCLHSITCGVYCWYILCFRPMLTLPHSSWRMSTLPYLGCSLLINFMFQAHADTDTLIMKNVYTPPLEVFIIDTFYVSGPWWHCHTHHEECLHSPTWGVHYWYILCFRPMLTLPHSSWRMSTLHHLRCSLLIHFMFQAHADTDTLIMKNVYTPPLTVFIIDAFYLLDPCWHWHTHHEECLHSTTWGVHYWYILCFRPMLTLPSSSWRMSTLHHLRCSVLIHFMFQAHADTATLIMNNVYTPPLEVFIIDTFYVSGPCRHCHTHHEECLLSTTWGRRLQEEPDKKALLLPWKLWLHAQCQWGQCLQGERKWMACFLCAEGNLYSPVALELGTVKYDITNNTTVQSKNDSLNSKKDIPYIGLTFHYSDVILSTMAYQITSLTIIYSTVYSGADQRKHQSSASLAFVWGIHRWQVNSLHKGPVMRKIFPFDDAIMPSWLIARLCVFWEHFMKIDCAIGNHTASCAPSYKYAMMDHEWEAKIPICVIPLTHWGQFKWPPFSRRHFEIDFLEWICLNFD